MIKDFLKQLTRIANALEAIANHLTNYEPSSLESDKSVKLEMSTPKIDNEESEEDFITNETSSEDTVDNQLFIENNEQS